MSDFTDNLFYKIIQGEMPSHKIYEDNDFYVILDKFPANPGHCLILPKTAAKDVFDLDEKTASKLYPLAKRLANAVKAATGCDGINILQNNGAAAGQVIFYFHLHVIPRFANDGVRIKTSSSAGQMEDEAAAKLQSKIVENL